MFRFAVALAAYATRLIVPIIIGATSVGVALLLGIFPISRCPRRACGLRLRVEGGDVLGGLSKPIRVAVSRRDSDGRRWTWLGRSHRVLESPEPSGSAGSSGFQGVASGRFGVDAAVSYRARCVLGEEGSPVRHDRAFGRRCLFPRRRSAEPWRLRAEIRMADSGRCADRCHRAWHRLRCRGLESLALAGAAAAAAALGLAVGRLLGGLTGPHL